ncbi:Hypothetical protein, putative [Bodo saltans]|uniref:WWE domain-containing protein n=1 Tax=Bodo saltans TaxID=75058 RepID=A0A0S4IVI9_BODSA|nr:Hypothetical protein, putative [Bodo saltans]|eukprot:CUF12918.1 Hypothetical protein, putative [Bodo saltans]
MATAPAESVFQAQWLFRDHEGNFKPVGDDARAVLEQARKFHNETPTGATATNTTTVVEYKSGKYHYKAALCFKTGVFSQFNTRSRAERPLLLLNATWSYQDDKDAWCPVPLDAAAELEAGLRTATLLGPRFQICFQKFVYEVDVEAMTQRNVNSGCVRSLAREDHAASASIRSTNIIVAENMKTQQAINSALVNVIGHEGVKSQLQTLADTLSFQKLQQQMEGAACPQAPQDSIVANMVLSGPSGVGKTTLVKAVAEILFAVGRLPKSTVISVTPKDLIGSYVGHTAVKTAAVIDSAIGGVLLIRQAHSIADETTFGPDCVAALMATMTTHRNDLVVILAGDADQMHRVFEMNPAGLGPLFPDKLRHTLLPLTADHLVQIFVKNSQAECYTIASDVDVKSFIKLNTSEAQRSSANGKLVEGLYSNVKEKLSVRMMALVRGGCPPQMSALRLLTAADFDL